MCTLRVRNRRRMAIESEVSHIDKMQHVYLTSETSFYLNMVSPGCNWIDHLGIDLFAFFLVGPLFWISPQLLPICKSVFCDRLTLPNCSLIRVMTSLYISLSPLRLAVFFREIVIVDEYTSLIVVYNSAALCALFFLSHHPLSASTNLC